MKRRMTGSLCLLIELCQRSPSQKVGRNGVCRNLGLVSYLLLAATAVRQIEGTSTKGQVPQILWSRGTGNKRRSLLGSACCLVPSVHGNPWERQPAFRAATQRSEWEPCKTGLPLAADGRDRVSIRAAWCCNLAVPPVCTASKPE